MGPRGDHNRAEFLEIVIDAAEAMARREGLRGLGMRPIAAAIGYAPNSIYNAVGDLDAIVLHLNARTLGRLAAHLSGLIGTQPQTDRTAAAADILALAAGYLDFVMADPRLWSLLFEHSMPELTAYPAWYQDALTRATGLVGAALAPLVPDEDERQACVAALWAALQGLAFLATSGKLAVVTAEPPHRLARLLVASFLDGIAARAGFGLGAGAAAPQSIM
jgi:AcrR family transcriptional regulator